MKKSERKRKTERKYNAKSIRNIENSSLSPTQTGYEQINPEREFIHLIGHCQKRDTTCERVRMLGLVRVKRGVRIYTWALQDTRQLQV